MALVKYGGGIVQMSGSIAGNTFARNRFGNYVRSRTKPVNPNTDAQNKIRAILAYLTECWSDILTVQQRADWGVYASNVSMKNRLGEAINLSGFNHYIRSNSIRLYGNRFVVNVAPVIFELPDKDQTVWIDVDDTPQLITLHYNGARAWTNENGGKMFVYQGIPQNGQRNFFAGPWHYLYTFDGTAGGGEANPGLLVPYYAVAETQRCWIKCRISRADGRLSEPFVVSAIVHAQAIGEVPNLIGILQTDAKTKLTSPEVQLTVGTITTANDPAIPVDHVISSDPVAHTRLNVGDPVNLVISLGPEV